MKKSLLLFALWCIGITCSFADETFRYKDPQNVVWICSPTNDADEKAVGSCVEMTGVRGCGTEVEVPCTVYNKEGTAYTVVKLSEVFCENTELQKVTLPTSVTILDGTFNGCTALTAVENTSQITEIGDDTFAETAITSVDLSACESVGYHAFSQCTALASVKLPLCKSISDHAFSYEYNPSRACTSLTSIDMPMCTKVGGGAFYGCTGLTTFNLPVCTKVEGDSFYGCTGLTSIDLPVCTTLGQSAFEGCTGLISVDLPVCTTVGYKAFYGCTEITTVNLPMCKSLDSYTFKKCKALTSLDLSSVESLSSNAFYGYTSLTSVKISSCKSVGEGAFSGCTGLTNIDLPSSVTYIGSSAFSGCTGLTRIYVSWETPLSIVASVFSGVDKQKCTLYVPDCYYWNYRDAACWGEFKNIVEYDVTRIDNLDDDDGAEETARYSANGQQVATPVKGLNIVKYSDGSVRKVLVR